MKFTFKALGLAVVASASSLTFAEAPALPYDLTFSGSAAVTTDYRFRGITQTLSDPAVQAGFTLGHASGFYFGLWGSNVDFGDGSPHLELDPSLGYATTLDNFSSKPVLDVGMLYYNYPSESDLNWLELYGKLTFSEVFTEGDSILTNINYTNDYAGADLDSWNVNASYSVPLASSGFGGIVGVGYTTIDEDDFFNGDDNYLDWKVGLTYNFKSLPSVTAELAAVGTNIDTDGLSRSIERGYETGAVFTLTNSF